MTISLGSYHEIGLYTQMLSLYGFEKLYSTYETEDRLQ